ncbi:MAG: MarR family transcriptional regulator [Actinomycetia bacterium]|nr:MarR family transcriptional regulator [Actinomycetes bacterium]MCP4958115.1 MarR family transcriptional regulator [Actinomycetes bacterium]
MSRSVAHDPVAMAVGNWRRSEWNAVDAMAAATSITRVHQVMTARIDAALKPLGLNFSRFEVLALLSFSREGQLPMGKIGDRLQVNAASVTNTIGRLEADGLVERVAHPTDGRATLARIRSAGRRAAKIGAAALADIGFGLEGLDPVDMGSVTEAFVGYRQHNGDFD